MAENSIRRGVSSVFSKGLITMNKNFLVGFDEVKAKTYSVFLDENNFFGGFIQKLPPPVGDFEIVDVDLS